MPFIPIRYGIPLIIVLFTAFLAVYTIQRDWESAEAVVRGEAVTHMINRMAVLQKQFKHTQLNGNESLITDEMIFLGSETEQQLAALADDSARVINASNKNWIGRPLFQTEVSEWQNWLNEPLQKIVERVKMQQGGEVLLLDSGRYVLGVYPVLLNAANNLQGGTRNGALVVRRDLSHDLARARRTVSEHTQQMVSMLGMLALVLGLMSHFFLSRRLGKLVNATIRFAKGQMETRANLSGRDEVARLGQAFDKMAEQVADTQRNLENRVRDRTEKLAHTVADLQNEIAQRRLAEHDLFNEKERIQITLASIGDAVITTDVHGRVNYLNPVAEKLIDISQDNALGHPLAEIFQIVDEFSRKPIENPVKRCIDTKKIVELSNNTLLTNGNGPERSIEAKAAPIHDRSTTIIGAVLTCRDVTEMRKVMHQLNFQATHDALTGLINRTEFEHRLERVLNTSRSDESHAMLYLDLDQFKIVNDTCGHAAGDELLRQVASLLQPTMRKRDSLARLGGDEFGVLLEHCRPEQATRIAQGMSEVMRDFQFVWEEQSFRVGVSIGLVPIEPGIDTLGSVFKTADSACYTAKEQGRNRIHIYQTDDEELARRQGEMEWIPVIQEALSRNRLVLFFQPIVPLSKNHGMHFEVLLRMIDSNGNWLPPSGFIPAAERYHQMQAIDRWVVSNAFEALLQPDIVPENVGLAINLSGQSIGDPQFLKFVKMQINKTAVPLERVCFEVTETAAISNLSHAKQFFSALKPYGCSFALDDFGSGLSSFAYLKSLPVDYLKIDGCFVKNIANDPIDHAMVEAIHSIGRVMKIETIAEFVENEQILDLLHGIGVNYAQGYHLCKPMPLQIGMASSLNFF